MDQKSQKKLNPDQFRRIVRELPEVRNQMKELPELIKKDPKRFQELFGDDISWAEIYELDFLEQIAYLFILLGMHEHFIVAGQAEDPQEATFELFEDGSILDQWYEANQCEIVKKHFLWLAVVFQRNILSIMLFHRSLGALVDEVRNGNDESFFKAISVDRSILSCSTFADRLSRAEITNDKLFFIHLRKALKGPSRKHMEAMYDLRFAIVVLRDMGFDKFSDNELASLFIGNRLYPNSYGAYKNLRKHIDAAKKFSTI